MAFREMQAVNEPAFAPQLDCLEDRLLLASDPVFATTVLPTAIFAPGGAYTIGIDGYDEDGDPLTVTAVSGSANLIAEVRQGTSYAVFNFDRRNLTTGASEAIGSVLVQLFDQESQTAVDRFTTLATEHINDDGSIGVGDAFYTTVLVHRIIPGFMIQGGDAVNANGTGGSPLGDFNDSFDPYLSFAAPGVLAMANSGPNTNDCQFFITEGAATHLNQVHMIFGQVITGWEVYEEVINWARDTNNMPTATEGDGYQPVLASVDIVPAGVNTQDATVSFRPVDGWTGATYVDVTLDDGNGGTITQRVSVLVVDIPEQAPIHTGVGQDVTLPTGVAPQAPFDIVWGAGTSLEDVGATVNPQTYAVTVDLPADFGGVVQFQVDARYEITFPRLDGSDVTRQFSIDSQTYTLFAQPDGVPIGSGLVSASYGSNIMDAFVAGNLLYVAAGANGLEIYDITDPAAAQFLGSYNTTGFARQVLVSGTTAYVADTGGGIVSLNVANPSQVTLLDVEMPGTEAQSYGVYMALKGSVLFVAGYQSGLVAFDVSNPAAMVVLSALKVVPGEDTDMENVVELVLKGNYAILSDFAYGYVAVDVSNPRSMRVLSVWGSYGSPWGMHLVGNMLYAVDANSGLLAVNVSNIYNPQLEGLLAIEDNPQHLTVLNETAVVGTEKAIVFVDISGGELEIEYVFPTVYPSDVEDANLTSKGFFIGSQLAVPVDVTGVVLFDASPFVNRVTVDRYAVIRDSANTPITIYTIGGAVARIRTTGIGTGDILGIEFTGTRTTSLYLMASKKFTVGGITIHGSVNLVLAPNAHLTGDFTAAGSVGSATFSDAVSGTVFSIGPRDAGDTFTATVLTFARVANLALTSQTPIRMLRAAEWLDTGPAETLTAPSIGVLYVLGQPAVPSIGQLAAAGDFQPNVTLSAAGYAVNVASIAGSLSGTWTLANGDVNSLLVRRNVAADITAGRLNVLNVYGNLAGSTINVQTSNLLNVMGSFTDTAVTARSLSMAKVMGNMERSSITLTAPWSQFGNAMNMLYVLGWLRDSQVAATGNLGTVYLGGIDGSSVTAGVLSAGLPAAAGDFDPAANSIIRALVILGIREGRAFVDSFIDSIIAAPQLGSMTTSYIRTQNDSQPHGLAATRITLWVGRFQVNGTLQTLFRRSLDSADETEIIDDFTVRVV